MSETPEQLETAIAALEAQRSVLGPAVVDTAIEALRQRLAQKRAAAEPAARLKQVSALFVDVVGSTAIGQRLSPEDISALMDGALARFTTIIRAHHGRVLQYTGDGLLAAFGADEANEDDVESAVLAGLAIVADTRRRAPALRERHGVPDFNVRVGIHTGQVLLGAGVDAEGSIRGAAVNLAARMEQSAPPGCVRISHDTWRHVSGLFDVVEQAPAPVKGVEQPVRGYLVERARPRSFRVPTRGVEGVATPMVGRGAELARLVDAFDAVGERQELHAVTVVGDAGLGKSRLVAEFQQALDRRASPFWTLLGRAQPRGASHPFGLLHDMLAWHLHIGPADSAADARTRFVDGLAPLFGPGEEAALHVLGHLIGFDFSASPHTEGLLGDEARLRERGFAAAVLLLRRLAAARGGQVLLLLDDIHWADEGSLAFVRHLVERARDLPLLAVLLTRPALFEADARWETIEPPDQRIDLRPLDRRDSEQLADMLLQHIAEVPPALRALVTGDAEGNPFYMEELVKMLLDDGIIVADGDGWRVSAQRLSAARVPQTLTGVLQARLDKLGPGERVALQQAAIVGAVFSEAALAAIDPASVQALPALLRRQLLRRAAPLFDTSREYAFGHHLLHQVTYESVLRDARLAGHARVGAFWRGRAEVGTPQDVDLAACRALTEAHEHGRIAEPRAFIDWFEGQFTNYLNAYVQRVLRPLAESVVQLADQHCGAADVVTARALTNLARVVVAQSENDAAEPLLKRALAIQESALGADHPDTARTIAVLGGYFQGRGDMRSAEPLMRRAFSIRERVLGPDHVLTIGTLGVLAHIVTELGRLDEAELLCRRVLTVQERGPGADEPETANAMTALAEVLVKRGDAPGAEPLIRRALVLQQRHLPARHPDIGLTLWHLAQSLRAQGRVLEAEPLARETLAMWEEGMGVEHEWTAWGLNSLAELRLALGDAAEAASLAERALRIYERLYGPDHAQVGVTLLVLAQALEQRGDAAAGPLRRRALAIRQAAQTAEATA